MRLRQVVIAAPRLAPVAERLQSELRLPEPFRDPGVGEFGLENAVFPVGDTFLEVVAPTRDDAPAGRFLARRGNPEAAGYMAIFQAADAADLAAARERVAGLGVRVVWQADLPDIAGTHLHPADVPGAIVSIDWADPPESWHWAGPAWRGGAPADVEQGRVAGFTMAVPDPVGAVRRWSDVLRVPLADVGVEVVAMGPGGTDGIVEIRVVRPQAPGLDLRIGTVRVATTI